MQRLLCRYVGRLCDTKFQGEQLDRLGEHLEITLALVEIHAKPQCLRSLFRGPQWPKCIHVGPRDVRHPHFAENRGEPEPRRNDGRPLPAKAPPRPLRQADQVLAETRCIHQLGDQDVKLQLLILWWRHSSHIGAPNLQRSLLLGWQRRARPGRAPAVGPHDVLGGPGDGGDVLDADDCRGARAQGHHREDPVATSHIQHSDWRLLPFALAHSSDLCAQCGIVQVMPRTIPQHLKVPIRQHHVSERCLLGARPIPIHPAIAKTKTSRDTGNRLASANGETTGKPLAIAQRGAAKISARRQLEPHSDGRQCRAARAAALQLESSRRACAGQPLSVSNGSEVQLESHGSIRQLHRL
mmetsp:Transcript_43997/g.141051  ORF Transcript_43997/g.141051 Transcript_43997/m.141051 type:complete len:354 (+) Transcript_43997:624-1685(+)